MKKAKRKRARKAMNPYVSGVGNVCYSWNRLVETLGHIFVDITKMDDPQVAQAIWYSLDSDRTQMKILEAAINATPEDRWLPRLPLAREDLQWLVKKSMDLADARNNAVHAPCIVQFRENGAIVVSDPFSNHPRAKRLSKTTLEDEFEYCIERATRLETFAGAAILSLRFEHGSAWPDRPSLSKRREKNGQKPNQTSGRR
jgi:hypothetical protein